MRTTLHSIPIMRPTPTAPGMLSARSSAESQPDGQRSRDYAACLARGNRKDLMLQSVGFKMTYFAVLFVLAWSGLALEAFFLWWLPLQIGFGLCGAIPLVGAAPPGEGNRPVPRHPQFPLAIGKHRVDGDAVPHRPSPSSLYSADPDAGRPDWEMRPIPRGARLQYPRAVIGRTAAAPLVHKSEDSHRRSITHKWYAKRDP